MSRSEDIFSFYPETLVIGTSLTATVTSLPGQISCNIKYGGGGTLLFLGTSFSSGCTFASAISYPLGASEILSFDGAGSFKIGAAGATVTAYLIRGRSQGFDQT